MHDKMDIKKILKGNMKGDFLDIPLNIFIFIGVMMAVVVVTIAWQTTTPILANIQKPYSSSCSALFNGINCTKIPLNIGNNIYNFNTWLPMIFLFVMISIPISTLFLDASPLSWLITFISLPFTFFLGALLSNIALKIFTLPTLQATAATYYALPLQIMANFQTIALLIGGLYCVCIAIRVWFFKGVTPGGGSTSSGTGAQNASLR